MRALPVRYAGPTWTHECVPTVGTKQDALGGEVSKSTWLGPQGVFTLVIYIYMITEWDNMSESGPFLLRLPRHI